MNGDENTKTGKGGDDDFAAAEHVLGLADAETRAAFARRLETDRELAEEVAGWETRLSPLDGGYEPVTPPPALKAAIEERLFGAAPEETTGLARLWNSLAIWRGLAAATSAAALVAVYLAVFPATEPTPTTVQLVASLEAEGAATQLLALFDPGTGQLRITPLSVQPVEDRDFEVWFIEADSAPISVGVISQHDHNTVDISEALQRAIHEGTTIAISLEPLGGSPTGQPTGPVVAAGQANLI